MQNRRKPVTIVVFGATGNLAMNKIFPALASLFDKNELPKDSRVVGVSRREWSDAQFRTSLRQTVGEQPLHNFFHSEVEFDEGRGYHDLRDKLSKLDKEFGASEHIFYLSLAPKFYEKVVADMNKAKLFGSSSKILIEKPFGENEKSARRLNKLLLSFFKHEQIYRVDHYLGKEAVKAIMNIHEHGLWLSTLLDFDAVKSIRLCLFEEKGIEKRGASYDGVGAFRDVGQNHMLEVLAVLCMTPPKDDVKAHLWHEARTEVIRAIMPPTKTCELSRRGQYDGYIKEWAIPDNSKTETAFEVVTALTKGKLKGVPITLQAGKKCGTSKAFIEVMMRDGMTELEKMFFHIQPEPRIELVYNSRVEKTVLSQSDAYENILLDAVGGERRHFVGGDEVITAWKYADRVVACWGKVPLEIYDDKKPFFK